MSKPIPISALQHFAYCPRQCALIHNEQVWQENWSTAMGQLLHQKVDRGEPETRKGIRFERAVQVESKQYGLSGKLDLLEIEGERYTPVEYKSGDHKSEDWDRIQLCAQAICLEEMLNIQIDEAALWYWRPRRREQVLVDEALRAACIEAITGVRSLFDTGQTPKTVATKKRCRGCSLRDLCQPELLRHDKSQAYWQELFIT